MKKFFQTSEYRNKYNVHKNLFNNITFIDNLIYRMIIKFIHIIETVIQQIRKSSHHVVMHLNFYFVVTT